MKKLKTIMLAFGLISLATSTEALAAGELLTNANLAPFWAKVFLIFGYLKTLIYIGFAFKFVEDLYELIKGGEEFDAKLAKKWGWYIFFLFMLQMVGLLLKFLVGGDVGVDFGAFGSA